MPRGGVYMRGEDRDRNRQRAVATIAVVAIGFALVISRSALATRGDLFPSLLVDPYADFSDVHLASWNSAGLPVNYPDRLIAVAHAAVLPEKSCYHDLPSHRVRRTLERLASTGQRRVALVFLRQGSCSGRDLSCT
jgi:hypothetical protein